MFKSKSKQGLYIALGNEANLAELTVVPDLLCPRKVFYSQSTAVAVVGVGFQHNMVYFPLGP